MSICTYRCKIWIVISGTYKRLLRVREITEREGWIIKATTTDIMRKHNQSKAWLEKLMDYNICQIHTFACSCRLNFFFSLVFTFCQLKNYYRHHMEIVNMTPYLHCWINVHVHTKFTHFHNKTITIIKKETQSSWN